MARRYVAMHTADGWRIWDSVERRWSETMDREHCRRTARLLGEVDWATEHVRWELHQPEAAA